jgi:alkanesulfonate monooxygenase SsuD/methylene tetrahydromethanopterin reductase-like flavin-dependent oxidoreductase (luciferase family)
VKFGLLLTSVHDRTVPPRQQIAEHRELISLAVEAGMDLVVAGQHFVAPNLRYLQPVPYLASVAAQFPSVRIATGIILLPLNHPVRVAEEAATLDVITNGRMILGLGGGYLQDEFDAFGIERSSRVARMEDYSCSGTQTTYLARGTVRTSRPTGRSARRRLVRSAVSYPQGVD